MQYTQCIIGEFKSWTRFGSQWSWSSIPLEDARDTFNIPCMDPGKIFSCINVVIQLSVVRAGDCKNRGPPLNWSSQQERIWKQLTWTGQLTLLCIEKQWLSKIGLAFPWSRPFDTFVHQWLEMYAYFTLGCLTAAIMSSSRLIQSIGSTANWDSWSRAYLQFSKPTEWANILRRRQVVAVLINPVGWMRALPDANCAWFEIALAWPTRSCPIQAGQVVYWVKLSPARSTTEWTQVQCGLSQVA